MELRLPPPAVLGNGAQGFGSGDCGSICSLYDDKNDSVRRAVFRKGERLRHGDEQGEEQVQGRKEYGWDDLMEIIGRAEV